MVLLGRKITKKSSYKQSLYAKKPQKTVTAENHRKQ
jgi:hypothetical protein